MWKKIAIAVAALIAAHVLLGFHLSPARRVTSADQTLFDARRGVGSGIEKGRVDRTPLPSPPADQRVFSLVRYPSALGELSALLSVPVADGAKHPAIIWMNGGDNVLWDIWNPTAGEVDEFAVLRSAGIIVLYPGLRGRNGHAGVFEGYYGEVDDVLSAAEYLSKLAYVDSTRVYLAGHSTGGTLALLTAEYDSRFRAVFSLAPVSDVRGYGKEYISGIAWHDKRSFELRSPIFWLTSIKTPVFIFEGDTAPANVRDVNELARASSNPLVRAYLVPGTNHGSSVAPVTALIAEKILEDFGDFQINFDEPVLKEITRYSAQVAGRRPSP